MTRQRIRRSRMSGFTLIELLVVVSIIALLISILVPSLTKARNQAKTLVCSTNIRSFQIGMLSYAEDQRGFIPRDYWYTSLQLLPDLVSGYIGGPKYPVIPRAKDPGWIYPEGSSLRQNRDGMLAVIFGNIKAMQCPSFPKWEGSSRTVKDVNGNSQVLTEQTYDYIVNGFDLDRPANGERYRSTFQSQNATKLDRIPSPGRLIYITEANRKQYVSLGMFGFHDLYDADTDMWWGLTPRMINDKRHGGVANAMFFDGHNETLNIQRSIRVSHFSPYVNPDIFKPKGS